MASSFSSSHVPQIKHDVFISFRGSDTRDGFFSHLTKELRHKQIDIYVDKRLETGEKISSTLFQAIEASEISLIIFSEDYASSTWCLEELVKIMECKEANGQIVIPVFYNVDPSDVRHQKGTYGDAFAKHEQRFKDNIEKVQIWRSILTKVANLSGYHYPSKFKNESKLIDEIVNDVFNKWDDIPPVEPKCLVGYENFAHVEQLLKIESQEVVILGIWGMGGIGKTTLALAVYENFFSQFESCSFLEKVGEGSKKTNGLDYLFQKLLSDLLGLKNLSIYDPIRARSIRRMLQRKKVLVVLDDVDSSEQVEYLVIKQLCLGPGSRVIITSRDKHVLIGGGAQPIYEVKKLNFEESLELFSLNAFKQRHPQMKYKKLSERVVNYAQGIPLALKILGSHLYSKNKETWKSLLKKLKKYPDMQIQNVLKVSYVGLDDIEKDIFLNIAFFFKGEYKDDVIRVLDACGYYAAYGIEKLLDKALITISKQNEIQMHDLLQEMCEQIIREESEDPRRRNRLIDIEKIYGALKNKKESDAVEGIILGVENVSLKADIYKWIYKWMVNLQLPSDYKTFDFHGDGQLPSNFKPFDFHWDAPLRSPKSLPLCPENLVELQMKHNNVRKLWDGLQDLVNLKTMDLQGCKQLMELPDFSMARNLRKVNLRACKSLGSIHPSILNSNSLVSLDLSNCKKLESLQSECHLKSLEILNVQGCSNLKEFSLSSKELRRLNLIDTSIEKLHCQLGVAIILKSSLSKVQDQRVFQ